MSSNRIVLNFSGVRDLLKSPEIKSTLTDIASDIRVRCGEGYTQDLYVGRNRANASVSADSIHAKRNNLKHNTLLKSLKG